jgi:hypothetical protein
MKEGVGLWKQLDVTYKSGWSGIDTDDYIIDFKRYLLNYELAKKREGFYDRLNTTRNIVTPDQFRGMTRLLDSNDMESIELAHSILEQIIDNYIKPISNDTK